MDLTVEILCLWAPCAFLLILPAVIVWRWRQATRREMASALSADRAAGSQTGQGGETYIEMDGMAFLRASDGRILIRPYGMRNWVHAAVLALAVLGLAALVVYIVVGSLVPPYPARGSFDFVPYVILVVWVAVFSLVLWPIEGQRIGTLFSNLLFVLRRYGLGFLFNILVSALTMPIRALRQPQMLLDPDERMLTLGTGANQERIPFGRITAVTHPPELWMEQEDGFSAENFAISIILDDGETLQLGTVSGTAARWRGAEIGRLIEETVGLVGPQAQTQGSAPDKAL